jgi:excisionase family DNA binding protein
MFLTIPGELTKIRFPRVFCFLREAEIPIATEANNTWAKSLYQSGPPHSICLRGIDNRMINKARKSRHNFYLELKHMNIDLSEYVTASEAARILGITRSTVNYLIKMRDLFAHKIGPRICLIRRDAVEALKARKATR